MFMGFMVLSLFVFGPIIFGILQLSDYLDTTHFAFLVLPLAVFGLLCVYWMFWFSIRSSQYFLAGDRTLFQSIGAASLDWWRCFRRLPGLRSLFRNPASRDD
jgi:hypothetical protein